MDKNDWIDSSIHADPNIQMMDKLLLDENYLANMRDRESIFKFIIQTFVFDPNDFPNFNDKYSILLIGYNAVALATELSQWKFPVILAVRNKKEQNAAKKVMDRYGGNFTITQGSVNGEKIIVWRDENKALTNDKKFEYLKFLSEKCQILIVSTKSKKIRERILKEIKTVNQVDKFGGTPLLIIYH